MTARMLPPGGDAIGRGAEARVELVVDGEPMVGLAGQTVAGVLLANDRTAWRTTARDGSARGLFCGIGVCFDCLVEVDGVPDVRACQRRARDGAVVRTTTEDVASEAGAGPESAAGSEDATHVRGGGER